MLNIDVSRCNAWILALFFFSQGLFIYVSAGEENHLRFILISIICLLSQLINGIKFTKKILIFFIVYLGIILLKFFMDSEGLLDDETVSAIRYLVEGCLICYLSTQDFSLKRLFRVFRLLAMIVCFEACMIVSN